MYAICVLKVQSRSGKMSFHYLVANFELLRKNLKHFGLKLKTRTVERYRQPFYDFCLKPFRNIKVRAVSDDDKKF